MDVTAGQLMHFVPNEADTPHSEIPGVGYAVHCPSRQLTRLSYAAEFQSKRCVGLKNALSDKANQTGKNTKCGQRLILGKVQEDEYIF